MFERVACAQIKPIPLRCVCVCKHWLQPCCVCVCVSQRRTQSDTADGPRTAVLAPRAGRDNSKEGDQHARGSWCVVIRRLTTPTVQADDPGRWSRVGRLGTTRRWSLAPQYPVNNAIMQSGNAGTRQWPWEGRRHDALTAGWRLPRGH